MEHVNILYGLLNDIEATYEKLYCDYIKGVKHNDLTNKKLQNIIDIIIKIKNNVYPSKQKCYFSIDKYLIYIIPMDEDLYCHRMHITIYHDMEYKKTMWIDYILKGNIWNIRFGINNIYYNRNAFIGYDKLYDKNIDILMLMLLGQRKMHHINRLPHEIYDLIYNEFIK